MHLEFLEEENNYLGVIRWKKILLLMFSVLCVNSFSYVERNDQVGNRGLELMRESNINQNMGLSKETRKYSNIDAYAGNGKIFKN